MATPLERAVKIAGGQTALARKINEKTPGAAVTQGQVWKWLQSGRPPAPWVIPIEKAVDGNVTRHQLRPDVYPREEIAA